MMQRSTFKILFYLKRNNPKPDGTVPIMGRITIDRTISQFSCKMTVPPNLWDTKTGRLTGKSTLAVKTNIALDKIRVDINRHYQDVMQTDGFVTADKVKNAYLGLGVKQDTFLTLFAKHNQEFSRKVGYNRAQASYSKYCTLYKHMENYIKQEYDREDIFLKELNLAFINGFEYYLRTERNCSTNTIWMYMIGVKHIIAIARNSGQLAINPFAGYLISPEHKDRGFLTKEELNLLVNAKMKNAQYELVRDLFVFSCFCGLSYSDVKNLTKDSRRLADYCEHEDLQRMEQGIYTEGFFNLNQDNLYKSQIVKDIDSNIGQLLKTDAKFYAVHVSPSEKELQAMGSTEQEQAEAMKWYIREVFIPEYAKNFNKGLSAEDIKFYGKIHFNRDRSENKLNMHCHLIISRKDQSNKVKISPLTNHRNTKKGVITGGFDRTALFENVEKGFDRLFGYNRQLSETFEYCNTMKNGTIIDKLQMQERELKAPEQDSADEKKKIIDVQTDENVNTQTNKNLKTFSNIQTQQQTSERDLGSLFSILPSAADISQSDEPQPKPVKKKKKKPKQRLS